MSKSFLGAALAAALLLFQGRTDDGPATARVDHPAPAFRLNDHEGRATTVGGESKTWTVLAFFPKAMTPG